MKAIVQKDTVIVTDGSAQPLPSPQGGGGVGVVCSEDGLTPSMIVGAEAGLLVTNISTEIAGITLAVRMIDKTTSSLPEVANAPNARSQWLIDHILNRPHPPGEEEPPPSFTIFSDCQYAIDACLLYAPPTHTYWIESRRIQRALHKIKNRGVRVTLDWIPGHCGHPLGDLADATAKAHSTDPFLPSEPSNHAPAPLKVAKNFIKARAHSWLLPVWWTNFHSNQPQRLFAFQPHPRNPPPILKHITTARRRTQISIYRLLLGQANNNNNMFHCGMRSSNSCSNCPHQKDSTDHRILHCPAYASQRSTLKSKLRSLGLTLSIPTAIGLEQVPTHHHPAATAALINFLETTDLTLLFVWDSSTQEPHPPTTPYHPHPKNHNNQNPSNQTLITQFTTPMNLQQ